MNLEAVGRELSAAMTALEHGLADDFERATVQLVALAPTPQDRSRVREVLERILGDAVQFAWQRGWQPIDLHHVVGLRKDQALVDLAGDVMAQDLAGYAPDTVEARWWAQLEAAQARVWWPRDSSPLAARVNSWGSWLITVQAAIRLQHALLLLGPTQQFGALPGQATRTTRPHDVDDRLLERVRQMLAKAESTTFEAEAETFTAAAQRLMARHRIDHAMLNLSAVDPDSPTGRRIWLQAPYQKEKSLLLAEVASANSVQTVWSPQQSVMTLTGFDADLDAVETLFTSLHIQATRAMTSAGQRHHAEGASRTRSFRASFLGSYAVRIGERLAQATDAETDSAATEFHGSGQELLPVLARRDEQVTDFTASMFGQLKQRRVHLARDAEGWAAGRGAADQAQLRWGDAITG